MARQNRPSSATGPGVALSGDEWLRIAVMTGVVVTLHLIGWIGLAASSLSLGVGLTAYTLGMRHAFDADHIAAIDGTTRKLLSDGRRALSVGFFFSLGHASVVFVLSLLLSLGVRAVVGPVQDAGSSLRHYGALVGTTVSGGFLLLIAGLNAVVLAGLLKLVRGMRQGRLSEADLERRLDDRGLLNRVFRRLMRSITRPWQIYPVGVLFGLGFDTVTEVGLLVLAGSATASGLPWYAVLCLPVLFAAGMSLFDTADGCFMNVAYSWAFAQPVRKIYYNLVITGLSIAVAVGVGGVELLNLVAGQLDWRGGFWHWLSGVNLNTVGLLIVGLFVATWLAAFGIWRYTDLGRRWAADVAQPELLD